jgi:hypothetical protein
MKQCPFCGEMIHDDAKVCKYCKSQLAKTCPYCAEEISAIAKKCRHCGSDLEKVPEEKPPVFIGQRRSVILWLILCILCVWIVPLVLLFCVGSDIKKHYAKSKINPTLDVLVIFCTGFLTNIILQIFKVGAMLTGEVQMIISVVIITAAVGIFVYIYILYTMYKYAKEVYEMSIEDEIPASDQSLLCLIVALFCCYPISLLIIQDQLNKHWDAHERPLS